MKLSEAIAALERGEKVRRKDWATEEYICIDHFGDFVTNNKYPYTVDHVGGYWEPYVVPGNPFDWALVNMRQGKAVRRLRNVNDRKQTLFIVDNLVPTPRNSSQIPPPYSSRPKYRIVHCKQCSLREGSTMKIFSTTKRGIEIWVLTTNSGTLLGTFNSEAGARTRYLTLGGTPTQLKR